MNFQGFGDNYQDQGSGGGFMSPGFGGSQTPSSDVKKSRAQSLLPVTAAIIQKAEYNATEDVFRFDGVEIHQVTFVGIIREISEAATNISYKIDDMTGDHISVRKWLDDDEKSAFKRSSCRENTYVRVVGNMKALSEGKLRNVMAFNITPVEDFDEITFHFLDVVHAKLALEKGSAMGGGSNMGSQMAQTPGQNAGGAGQQDNFGGGFNDAGLTGQNKLVFNYISACSDEQGIHFQTLKNKCRGVQEKQLRNCIEWLSNEGHIYSTIDDDHYRSTSS